MRPQTQAILIVDLAYGDCGKGTIVDFLARRLSDGAADRAGAAGPLVVRFNGGPQAAHNVVAPDGRHHTFAQFGSASFTPGARTFLSRFMLIEPYALFNEASHLARIGVGGAVDRLFIDRRCRVITPAHQAGNRLREIARGNAAHGTCGVGVGETMADDLAHPEQTLRAGDLSDRSLVARRLAGVCGRKRDELRDVLASPHLPAEAALAADTLRDPSWIEAAVDVYAELARRVSLVDEAGAACLLRGEASVLFEGAQGVLLDEWRGFHPHTTWSTTTFANADAVLDEAGWSGRRIRLGLLRTYFTRHGAGPLVTESPELRASLPEPHNADAGWQGRFRVGLFDAVAARYALAVTGTVDALVLTHVDRLPYLPPQICTAYQAAAPASDAAAALDPFIRSAVAAIDLRPCPSPDLAYQQRLTHALLNARPIYSTLPGAGEPSFVQAIESELGAKVALTSLGPTALDKRAHADGAVLLGRR